MNKNYKMTAFTESEIEIFSLNELKRLGFSYIPGPSIAPDVEVTQGFLVAEPAAPYGESTCAMHADRPEKRKSYSEMISMRSVVRKLNEVKN
ncbi:MAG: hypothetical protein AAB090_03405 [Nitrospirota bacterium]